MYFSLNKKFFFTIIAFLLLSACIFVVIFDGVVGKKIRAEHSNIISRNQYVIELLNENIKLRSKLDQLNPNDAIKTIDHLSQKKEELSQERRLNEELAQNYDEKYASLSESLKIISLGAVLTLISLVILWFLLRQWVITPLDKLTMLSVAVANGDFSQRIKQKKGKITDEFDVLMSTVNFMLDSIENNINEIKQKELFLQNLIDSLPDAIRIIDNDYNVILSNKAYADHINKKYLHNATKCYKTYNKKSNCPCSSSQYICPLDMLTKNKQTSIRLIHSINDRPFSINSARINLNGKIAILESLRDLSENIHYSHQQKISSLGFLATSLAHEMKNNLGAINLILSGLLQKYYQNQKNSEEKKYLEMIATQITECIKVPERLLKLARNNDNSTGEIDIITSIEDILELFDYEIKSKGIVVSKDYSDNINPIYGNETDFRMIILNLIQNAINAMLEGGSLSVTAKKQDDEIIIQIQDTGCGISPEALKHIFEPFYSASANPDKKGTGLGLAIVKDLVTRFNARITVESTEKLGTCFKISFPQ